MLGSWYVEHVFEQVFPMHTCFLFERDVIGTVVTNQQKISKEWDTFLSWSVARDVYLHPSPPVPTTRTVAADRIYGMMNEPVHD